MYVKVVVKLMGPPGRLFWIKVHNSLPIFRDILKVFFVTK